MSGLVVGIISLILLFVCYTDIRYRLIHNWVVITVFLLSLIMTFLVRENNNITLNIYAPLLILVIGFVLNYINIIGAGDVKLLVALTIGLSNESVYKLLLLVALAGLPVAILAYIVYRIRKNKERCEVPYGVAIAIGYWVLQLSFYPA